MNHIEVGVRGCESICERVPVDIGPRDVQVFSERLQLRVIYRHAEEVLAINI